MLKAHSKIFLVTLFFAAGTTQGQIANYVINPSFEEIQTLPWHPFGYWVTGWSAIDTVKGAFLPRTVGPPYYNAPNSSYGFQNPKAGSNFILTNFYCSSSSCGAQEIRWYPRNRLKSPLIANKTYCAKYHVVNTNNCVVGIDSYGILLADSSLDTITHCSTPLPYLTPQITHTAGIIIDTLSWVPISGTFVAVGSEKYMVLGNFKSNAATQTMIINPKYLPALGTDLYIDDVSLVEMELPAFAGNDTNIVVGDSAFIGREPDVGIDYACQWYQLPNDTVPIDTVAGLWVKPTTKTTYVVKQQLWCSGVKWDTVTIHFNTVSTFEEKLRHVKLSPNPCNGRFTLSDLPGNDRYEVSVTDATGRLLLRKALPPEALTHSFELDVSDGIYFLSVTGEKGRILRKVVVEK